METRLAGQDVALEPLVDDDEETLRADRLPRRPGGRARPHARARADRAPAQRRAGSRRSTALDPRSRRIIEARWLREKDAATLHDLAAEFGVSAERIRQIEAKAMQKMRGVIGADAR